MMSEALKIEIEYMTMFHIIWIIISVSLLMYFNFKIKIDYSVASFYAMQVSVIGWLVFKIGKTVSYNIDLRWFFILCYYFCICSFQILFLEFTYSFYKKKPLPIIVRRIIIAILSVQFLGIVTNPLHHMFYKTYNFYNDTFGEFFYVYMITQYLIIITGLVYGGKSFKKKFVEKKLAERMFVAFLILMPIFINLAYVSGIVVPVFYMLGFKFEFDITPFAVIITTYSFFYVMIKDKLFVNSLIMRHEVVNRLDTCICMLDRSFKVFYVNEKVYSTLGENAIYELNKVISDKKSLSEFNGNNQIEVNGLTFICYLISVKSLNMCKYIIALNNITDYKKNEARLVEERSNLDRANNELMEVIGNLKEQSKIGARKYVGIELHDIIGHSLVVVIKLLEVAKLYLNKDKKIVKGALNDCIETIDAGIITMENINQKSGSYKGYDLKKSIDKKLNKLNKTNLSTFINFEGEHCEIEAKTYDTLSGVCTELITNSVKHSSCKKIFISVKIDDSGVNILFIDDGIGCKKLEFGNGLSGIYDRITNLGGEVEFITDINQGFTAKISI